MSKSPIRWLGGDMQIDDRRFCHGDNGTQEFYETIIASQRLLLGILKNHGEDIWIAYVIQREIVRTLTGCSHRADGRLDAEPLYDTTNNPQALAEGLIRLWREHGERMVSLPCAIIAQQEERCA
jgi:hypothetical protein